VVQDAQVAGVEQIFAGFLGADLKFVLIQGLLEIFLALLADSRWFRFFVFLFLLVADVLKLYLLGFLLIQPRFFRPLLFFGMVIGGLFVVRLVEQQYVSPFLATSRAHGQCAFARPPFALQNLVLAFAIPAMSLFAAFDFSAGVVLAGGVLLSPSTGAFNFAASAVLHAILAAEGDLLVVLLVVVESLLADDSREGVFLLGRSHWFFQFGHD
jgi:hypothetical protein